MSYSLQTINFVNSKSMGSYLTLELPFGKNQSAVSFKIHYYEEGSGDPLVLVHSAGQSLYTWRKLISALSERFRVIAVDLMGHGYSDAAPFCSYSIDEQATVLGIFLTKLGISSAHFVGYSLGCAVIAALMQSNAKRIGRVVFISPGGVTPLMPTVIRMLDSRLTGIFGSMLLSPRNIRNMLSECYLDLTLINETMVEQYIEPIFNPDCKRAIRSLVQSYDEEEFINRISSAEIPVHVLTSTDDRWRSDDMIQPIFNALLKGSSAVIRNAGHLIHEEKAEKTAAAIIAFIAPDDTEEDTETKKED